MRVRIKLFAILRERAGASELIVHLRPGATVADAVTAAGEKVVELVPYLGRIAFAVNETYAKANTPLNEGDELAFIPPVSGGRD